MEYSISQHPEVVLFVTDVSATFFNELILSVAELSAKHSAPLIITLVIPKVE